MENISNLIKYTMFGLALFVNITPIMAMADQPSSTTQISKPQTSASLNEASKPTNPPHFCPLAKELTKKGLQWSVGKNWVGDSDSFVKEIGSFVGAQWAGIKYGAIICLYQGKDNIDFPVSIQQVHSSLILEPFGSYWSGLVQNRKLCKSANVYDCPFFIEPKETVTDIYKQIEYKGPAPQGILNEPKY